MSVSVHALRSGILTVPAVMFIATDDKESKFTCPSNSFLIQKPAQDGEDCVPIRLVFDLGMPKLEDLPASFAEQLRRLGPVESSPSVVDSLAKGDLRPDDVDYIIFSHVAKKLHLDHIGTPSDFPKAQFIAGPGTYDLAMGNTKLKSATQTFHKPSEERTIELPSTGSQDERVGRYQSDPRHKLALSSWKAVGPLEKTLDIFEDGSVFLVSLPGHLPGHLGLLAKVSLDPLKYVLLVGDACHHPGLLDGSEQIGEWHDESSDSVICIHNDRSVAEKTISQLSEIQRNGIDGGEVEVVLAHDRAWAWGASNDHRFWPGKI